MRYCFKNKKFFCGTTSGNEILNVVKSGFYFFLSLGGIKLSRNSGSFPKESPREKPPESSKC